MTTRVYSTCHCGGQGVEEHSRNYVSGARGRKGRVAHVMSCSEECDIKYHEEGDTKVLFDSGDVKLWSSIKKEEISRQDAKAASLAASVSSWGMEF